MPMRIPALFLALAAGGCALHRASPPRTPAEANLSYQYYDVTGSSVGEVMVSLQQGAPESTRTDVYFARTTWTVTWDGNWQADSAGCGVLRSTTHLESRMALPRWRATGASVDLRADWNSFVRSLSLHEHGHVTNAVAASREVETRLGVLRRPTCDEMEAAARATIDSIVAVFRAQDEAYDERTRHGEAQGAVWPPRAARNLRTPGPTEAVRDPPIRMSP